MITYEKKMREVQPLSYIIGSVDEKTEQNRSDECRWQYILEN